MFIKLVKDLVPRKQRSQLTRLLYLSKGRLGMDTSQHKEYELLRSKVPDDAHRLVVEVGAYDGITYSSSYPFVHKGWSLIAIEPHPHIYQLLCKTHVGNDNVTCINMACSNIQGTLPLYIGKGDDTTMLSTLDPQTSGALAERKSGVSVDVQVDTLTNVLLTNRVPKQFGLLIVDTEGMDFEVLQGLDFSYFHPDVICTEDYELKDAAKAELLQQQGYAFLTRISCNSIWNRI